MDENQGNKRTTTHSGLQGIRNATGLATLRPFLDALLERYHQDHWISSDPVQFAWRYETPADQEMAALLSACFAYGSVKLVHRAVEAILKPMGKSPAEFVGNFDGKNHWPGFSHRFHKDGHLVVLVEVLRQALLEYGSLSDCFRKNECQGGAPAARAEAVLNGAAGWFHQALNTAVQQHQRKSERERLAPGLRYFFNAPQDGSACKRMVMFLRWMVRKDKIDLGLWDWMKPAELVVPLDTHVARISHYLGLRAGRELAAPNWRMAREVTASLRAVNAEDPVLYDFALARLGILNVCKRRYELSVCERCPLSPGCRYSQLPDGGARHMLRKKEKAQWLNPRKSKKAPTS